MGLFDWLFGKKKKTVQYQSSPVQKPAPQRSPQTNSLGQRMDRLTPEGRIPTGWLNANSKFLDQQDDIIGEKAILVRDSVYTEERLAAYREYFATVTEVGELCKKTGVAHYEWFCKYVIGSPDYEYHVAAYQQLKIDAPKLMERERYLKELYEVIIPKLKTELLQIIKDEPGVIQSNLYKRFPVDKKDYVSKTLYYMAKDGKITREKSGRTYKLFPR